MKQAALDAAKEGCRIASTDVAEGDGVGDGGSEHAIAQRRAAACEGARLHHEGVGALFLTALERLRQGLDLGREAGEARAQAAVAADKTLRQQGLRPAGGGSGVSAADRTAAARRGDDGGEGDEEGSEDGNEIHRLYTTLLLQVGPASFSGTLTPSPSPGPPRNRCRSPALTPRGPLPLPTHLTHTIHLPPLDTPHTRLLQTLRPALQYCTHPTHSLHTIPFTHSTHPPT